MSAGPGDSTAPSGPPDGAHPSVTSGEGHTGMSSQGGRFRSMSDMDLPTGAGRSQTEKMSRSLDSMGPSGAIASTEQTLQQTATMEMQHRGVVASSGQTPPQTAATGLPTEAAFSPGQVPSQTAEGLAFQAAFSPEQMPTQTVKIGATIFNPLYVGSHTQDKAGGQRQEQNDANRTGVGSGHENKNQEYTFPIGRGRSLPMVPDHFSKVQPSALATAERRKVTDSSVSEKAVDQRCTSETGISAGDGSFRGVGTDSPTPIHNVNQRGSGDTVDIAKKNLQQSGQSSLQVHTSAMAIGGAPQPVQSAQVSNVSSAGCDQKSGGSHGTPPSAGRQRDETSDEQSMPSAATANFQDSSGHISLLFEALGHQQKYTREYPQKIDVTKWKLLKNDGIIQLLTMSADGESLADVREDLTKGFVVVEKHCTMLREEVDAWFKLCLRIMSKSLGRIQSVKFTGTGAVKLHHSIISAQSADICCRFDSDKGWLTVFAISSKAMDEFMEKIMPLFSQETDREMVIKIPLHLQEFWNLEKLGFSQHYNTQSYQDVKLFGNKKDGGYILVCKTDLRHSVEAEIESFINNLKGIVLEVPDLYKTFLFSADSVIHKEMAKQGLHCCVRENQGSVEIWSPSTEMLLRVEELVIKKMAHFTVWPSSQEQYWFCLEALDRQKQVSGFCSRQGADGKSIEIAGWREVVDDLQRQIHVKIPVTPLSEMKASVRGRITEKLSRHFRQELSGNTDRSSRELECFGNADSQPREQEKTPGATNQPREEEQNDGRDRTSVQGDRSDNAVEASRKQEQTGNSTNTQAMEQDDTAVLKRSSEGHEKSCNRDSQSDNQERSGMKVKDQAQAEPDRSSSPNTLADLRAQAQADLMTPDSNAQTPVMSASSAQQPAWVPSDPGQKQGQGMESVQTGSAGSSEQHKYKIYHISANLAQLLQVQDVSDKLKAKLMDKECLINCKSVTEGFINIVGNGREEDVTATLKELFHWELIDVGEDDQDVEKALKSFKEKHAGKVSYVPEEKGQWNICVTANIKDDIHSELERLKQVHCLVHLPLYVSELVAFKMDRVNSWIKADVDGSVNVSVPDDGEKLGIELSSERKYMKKAVEWLHNFVLELETTEKNLEMEEACFFQDLEGQKMIQEVEGEFFCRIDTVVDEDWSGLCVTAPSGQQLLVCQDTMAATDCDCIVLPLWEGQTEWTPLQKWILRRSFLSENIASYHEVCHKDPISLPGNADFLGKMIIIVPVPAVWGDGASKEKERITTSYKKAFALCGEHQRSVAVCAKQSPKFPIRKSVKPLLVAVRETFSTQDPPSTACQTVVIYADSVQDRMMTCQDVVNFLPSGWHLKPPRVPRSTPGKGIIEVCIGEIQKIKADIIVNSTDRSLMSNEGAVQRAIGLAAGPEMFNACRKFYPHGISVNGLAVTDSFRMKNAKKIYHIALSRDTFMEQKRNVLLHDLRQVILRCLVKASLEELTSIAFPTLGSGQLRYPCDDVARVMFSTISSFFREMPHTTLQNVIIVVYQGNLAAIQSLKMEEISQLYTFSSDEEQAAQTPEMRMTLESHRIQIIHGNVFQKPWVTDFCLHGKLASERGESSQTGGCQSIIVDNVKATKEGYKNYLKAVFRKGITVQIAADTLRSESLEDLASALESVLSCYKSGRCLVSVVFSDREKAYTFGHFFQKVQSGHLELDQGKGHRGQMFVSSGKDDKEIARRVEGFQVSPRYKKLMKSYQQSCRDQVQKQNERRDDQDHNQVRITLPTALLEDVDLSQIMNDTHTGGEKITNTLNVKIEDLVSTAKNLSEIIGMKSKEKEPGRSEKISGPEEETTEDWSIVMDELEVEALKFLLREEFDQVLDMKENQDRFLLTFKGASSKAVENQVASLRREDVQLNPEEVALLGDTVDVRSEGVEAFVKPVPSMNKAAVFAFDYNAMSKAKHLVTVKSGRVKVTARSRRRFDAGVSGPQDQTSSKPGDFSPPMSDAQPKVFTTPSGIKVSVYKADITKLPIDAIVNAANENLAHGGGVAAVISRAAGFALEEEGREHLRTHGPLQVTEVVDTTAGSLACSKVLHAVGPRWGSYADKAQCQQHLVDTVFNCLEKAGSLGFTSVALPSISAAIFGVPQHICAQSYLSAVKKFDSIQRHTTSLREIHFVDINDAMISTIQSTFSAHWNAPTSSNGAGDQAIQTAAGGRNKQEQSSRPVPNMSVDNQEKPQGMPHVPVPNKSEESQERPLDMQPQTGTSQGLETVVFPCMSEVWADKEQQVQIVFKDQNVTLILRSQPVTDTASGSVILWQDFQNIMRDTIWKQFKKKMSHQASTVADSFKKSMTTTDKIYDFNTTNRQYVFIVVPSTAAYGEEKIKGFVEQALNKVDLAKKKTVAITGKPKEGKAKASNKDTEDSEIFTHALYKAVKNYARRSARSITEVHVMEPDPNTLLLMVEKLRTLVAIDQSLLEQSKSQPPPQSANPTSRSAHSIDPCSVCWDRPTDSKPLRCGHVFCTPCIDKWFQTKPTCPACNSIQGIVLGDQPEDGTMRMRYASYDSCPGFPPGKYIVEYSFPGGCQKRNHPNPGKRYSGTSRTAYLPDTQEGRKVLMLLKVAFDRRLIFTIGKSVTSGYIGIVWNDIHHKTYTCGGSERYGYPDPTYLTRVQEELAAKGVTGKDLTDTQLDFITSPTKVQSEYPAGRDFSEYFRERESCV